ncbi:glycosyltransferase family 2 protein [Rubrivirga sp.]|uniref:glycosyltransferase family 2 protein n=1 Tax=Rubrivirga sp. TaxID=1885344 RepID=UPI003B523EF1
MRLSLVSVLIPAYNAERYVGEAIESVLSQTYPHVEIIVVNDGSTDGTREVLGPYEAQGVRVIDQPNAGQCAAANRAFSESNGELVKFFDADDVLAPDHVARQVERLGDRRDAVAVGEWARFYGDDPETAVFEPLPMYRNADPVDWLTTEWTGARPMMQCALWLIPREVLGRSGLWDRRLSLINDFEFFSRVLLSASEVLYTPGARLFYRSGLGASLSGRKSRPARESQALSLLLGTQHLLDAEDSPKTRRACAHVLQDFVYDVYPQHPDLRARVHQRVAELGGSDLPPDGPPGFQRLRRFVGWRLARRVERAAERLGRVRNRRPLIAPG